MNAEQTDDRRDGLFSIAGKTALVTGGSRGIGLMIADAFVKAGARVYITSRKAEVCDAVARELSASGECISLPCDLATHAACSELATRLGEREQQLDILINNAGAAWGEPLDDYSEDGFDKLMDLNLKAVFFLTQKLLPLLRKSGRPGRPARVINIGSIDGLRVTAVETYAYSATKAAVHHLTRTLAVRLGPEHISVNAIAPGPFESKMTAWLLEKHKTSIEKQCPLGRIGAPEDMAGIAIFLASAAAAYINGAVIPVDGGLSLR